MNRVLPDLTRFNKVAIQGTPQMAVDKEARAYRESAHIFTTIGGLSSQICPQNLTKIYPCGPNSTAIIVYIFYAYILPIRYPCATGFCVFPLFLRQKNHQKTQMLWKRIDRRNRSSAQLERWSQSSTADQSLVGDTGSCGPTAGRVAAQRPTGCCSASSNSKCTLPLY